MGFILTGNHSQSLGVIQSSEIGLPDVKRKSADPHTVKWIRRRSSFDRKNGHPFSGCRQRSPSRFTRKRFLKKLWTTPACSLSSLKGGEGRGEEVKSRANLFPLTPALSPFGRGEVVEAVAIWETSKRHHPKKTFSPNASRYAVPA